MIVVPGGWYAEVGSGRMRPWASWLIGAAVAILFLLEQFLLSLPETMQSYVIAVTGSGRFNPDVWLREPWQWITGALFMADWWFASTWIILWLWAAPQAERECGPGLMLLILCLGSILAHGLAIFLGLPSDQYGMYAWPLMAWAMAAAGWLAKRRAFPSAWVVVWRWRMLDIRRVQVAWWVLIIGFVLIDSLRLLWWAGAATSPRHALVHVLFASGVVYATLSFVLWWQYRR